MLYGLMTHVSPRRLQGLDKVWACLLSSVQTFPSPKTPTALPLYGLTQGL